MLRDLECRLEHAHIVHKMSLKLGYFFSPLKCCHTHAINEPQCNCLCICCCHSSETISLWSKLNFPRPFLTFLLMTKPANCSGF